MTDMASADGGQGAAPTVAPVDPVNTGAITQINNGTPAQPISWLQGADDATVGYVQNKGWTEPAQVLDGYRNLEKLLGADKANNAVVIPKGDADPKEWANVYDRLGRPTGPDGYKVALPEGADPAFQKNISEKFFELGLTKGQGEAFSNWLHEAIATGRQQQEVQTLQSRQQDMIELQAEWGAAFNQNKAAVETGMLRLGVDEATADKIGDAIGWRAALNLFAKIGNQIGEQRFVSGEEKPGFGGPMTPAQAQARINELRADPAWSKAYLTGGPNSKENKEMQRLMGFVYGE